MRLWTVSSWRDSCLCLASSCCEGSAEGEIEFISTLLSGCPASWGDAPHWSQANSVTARFFWEHSNKELQTGTWHSEWQVMELGTCHWAGVFLGLLQCFQLGELLWTSFLALLGYFFSVVLSFRLYCWEILILVKNSNIHSAHVSSPGAQVPGHSSQKQHFAQKGT